jgi:hypothetical protein
VENTNKKLFGINPKNTDMYDIDTQKLSGYLCCLALGITDKADLWYPDSSEPDGVGTDMMDDFGKLNEEVEKGLYYIKTCAENSYNNDYFRVLIRTLNKIMDFDYKNADI